MATRPIEYKQNNIFRFRLFNITPMDFLQWVMETYIHPKPEITTNSEVTNAKVKLQNEIFCLSVDVNPVLNGTELICEYSGRDNWKALHDFEHGVDQLSAYKTLKEVVIPRLKEQMPKQERSKPKQEYGEQGRTSEAIEYLKVIRSETIRERRPTPTRKAAAKMAGITVDTWKKRAPELYHKWDQTSWQYE